MTPPDPPQDASDESFLDLVFERAVAALEEGHSLSVSELVGGREDLRREVERLVLDARSVACVRPDELPSVRGYTVIEELGRGGMGAVYLARQDALGGRRVALKLLPAAASASARSRTRFLHEARTLASVRHPNVVTVHDVIESDTACAYAMEWVDGASLSQLIQRARSTATAGRQPELAAVTDAFALDAARSAESYALFICRVGLAIARALDALHRAGLVHRDVKPSNVLLRRDGTALLSDFGLVRSSAAGVTKTGEFVGTVLYASPEQLEGESERLDARSDIYSLGVTLYQALTLQLPFDEASADSKRATTPTGMLRLIESRSAVPLRARDRSLPRDLETIVATALETDPQRRYASADELADDLERLLSLQPIHARPASLLSRTAKFVRRNRSAARGLIVGSAASIALALTAVVYVFFAPRWADEHVREARLALLDPVYANTMFVHEQFEAPARAPGAILTHDGLRRSLASYEAALRWNWFDRSIGAERDVVARALDGKVSKVPAGEPRLAGLSAYLAGDVDGALKHWSDAERLRDPRASADLLVEAMLGVLLLVRDEPARAYPRLREACRMFPDVGFLATYHADAAVRCGDYETAERLLSAARDMPRLDPLGAHERVTADLYAATGRDDEAESLYRAALQSPIAALHLARLFERDGRFDDAIEQYLVAFQRLSYPALRSEYATIVERWWASLSEIERSQAIAATLELSPTDPHSLVARLRELRLAPVQPEKPAVFAFFATLRRQRSSPPLQSLGLPELAEILEVEDMKRWNEITQLPVSGKSMQRLAWSSPWPRELSRVLRARTQQHQAAAMRAALLSLAAAAPCAVARAQSCPGAPCFQGLGDLAGGVFESSATAVSADGSTVVGQGKSAAGTEAFRWTAATGIVGLGDLAGGAYFSTAYDVSADGSVVCGDSFSGAANHPAYPAEAFRWTAASGMTGLGDTPGGYFHSYARAISPAGDRIAGSTLYTSDDGGFAHWSLSTGQWTLVPPASGVQDQGAVQDMTSAPSGPVPIMVGFLWDFSPSHVATYFNPSTGMSVLGDLPGGATNGIALAVSADGAIVVGQGASASGTEAFRWTASGGMLPLGDLAGGGFGSVAYEISGDGALIVGYGTSVVGLEAVLWDDQLAIHRVSDVLAAAGVSIPSGWILRDCTGIAKDWCTITLCGSGTNPSGETEAWVARYECYPGNYSYCTAGTTSSGCNASMSASGTPSVSATSGFTLSCSNVEGQKFGLIFYGVNGPNAAPWAPGSSSVLCVKSPVQRTASANSGGAAGACDGSFSLDFLSYLATHPVALGQPFAAGRCVNAQTWFRDPPAPGTTNLSNGLQFVMAP